MARIRLGAFLIAALVASASGCELDMFSGFKFPLEGGSGGGSGGGRAPCTTVLHPSRTVVVRGTVRLAVDSTPHPWTQPVISVLLCGMPSQAGAARADSLGRFTLSFAADCAATYVFTIAWMVTDSLGTWYRESIVHVSGIGQEYPPQIAMPADACGNGDWPIDVWVNSWPSPR